MKNLIVLLCAFVFVMGANASEKPKEKLGGGVVLGVARLIGETPKLMIMSCDKSKKTCLYILKKVEGTEPQDECSVIESWTVPATAEQQFDSNYPFAFAFDTDLLTFYPATSINVGCRNDEGVTEISIETEANVELP